MFDSGLMAPDRPGPAPDRLLVARLDGVAKRHARWRKPAEPDIAAAATELREVAGNRADLLAEVAGILPGASEGRLDEPRARAAAQLRTAAGAGESKIPQRIQEGRRRAEPPAESPPQPASSYTTAALNASGRRETGRFFRGRGDRRPRPGARAAPSWRAQAAPGGDHRLRLSQHGRPCVRVLSGVAGDGDSPNGSRASARRWSTSGGS